MPPAIIQFRVMEVLTVTLELPSQFPVVTLRETEPSFRHLAMPMGMAEGVALAHALGKVRTPRPLTHELLVSVLQRLGADVVAVRLVGRTAGTYLGELELMSSAGREVIACRPSDGIITALRLPVPAPILVDERLLDSDEDVAPT